MSALHALNGHDTPTPAAPAAGQNTVKNPLTPNRAGRLVENDEYAAFARRVLRSYARRIATGDVEALTLAGRTHALLQPSMHSDGLDVL